MYRCCRDVIIFLRRLGCRRRCGVRAPVVSAGPVSQSLSDTSEELLARRWWRLWCRRCRCDVVRPREQRRPMKDRYSTAACPWGTVVVVAAAVARVSAASVVEPSGRFARRPLGGIDRTERKTTRSATPVLGVLENCRQVEKYSRAQGRRVKFLPPDARAWL